MCSKQSRDHQIWQGSNIHHSGSSLNSPRHSPLIGQNCTKSAPSKPSPSPSSSSPRPSYSSPSAPSSRREPTKFPSPFRALGPLFPLFVFALFCAILTVNPAEARIRRRDLPLSMDKEMFPPQDFDEEAPICLAEREPCGFYSFSLDGKAPLKWIKSWCRCSPKHECIYERTDMRMRVYRQTCVPKSATALIADDDDVEMEKTRNAAEIEQQQTGDELMAEQENKPPPSAGMEMEPTNQTALPVSHARHHHHHHHHRHARKANRRVIRRLRAILVD